MAGVPGTGGAGTCSGVPAPPAAWAGRGLAESAAERGSGLLGTHGGPRLARPARLLCSACLGPGQPSPARSNHSLHLSREVQRVLFLLFHLGDSLAAALPLACQPCCTGSNTTTKLTSTLRGDTCGLQPFVPKQALDSKRPLPSPSLAAPVMPENQANKSNFFSLKKTLYSHFVSVRNHRN